MRFLLFIFLSTVFILPAKLFSQAPPKGYTYIKSVHTGLQRKMYANEVMFDDEQKYLVVNYGHKPSYIVVFEYETFDVVKSFRLPNWVEFSGAYFDYEKNDFFVKASRYSNEYYKMNLISGEYEIRECTTLPNGCEVVEPKQSEKTVYSLDKKYCVSINKKNERDVRVFLKP